MLSGGPRDQTPFNAAASALVELEIDGLIHRYIGTHQRRDLDGRSLAVYRYDGAVRKPGHPKGAEPRDGGDRPAPGAPSW
ncbi:hypothetical protein SAMN05444365_11824 [Micromonospora pattaloongensis]|uniref:Uncharacterized protein n=1 Tax=Micromonospora pattaloongensis TaxID=405436 RepID=A0A1H3T6W4_9ACTN|nr:hypothetical protein SAMN05444365_11824 [Micromonospora pattaloongensis]